MRFRIPGSFEDSLAPPAAQRLKVAQSARDARVAAIRQQIKDSLRSTGGPVSKGQRNINY